MTLGVFGWHSGMIDFEGVAKSRALLEVLDKARRVAMVPRPVLIRGERGTGKELVARFIHNAGPRAGKPFVVINCAAFVDALLRAEIYGHEKGAFTGAEKTRIGRLELANEGTLFMDEIGNMSLPFQETILRVVEYQQFERVGGTAPIKVDVRIISATNADLEDLMRDKLFRKDLYDRLTFVALDVPPLRRRKEDIPHLVVHFVQKLHEEIPVLSRRRFQKETVEAMMDYYWPGNVRELRNIVERVYLYGLDEFIRPSDLPPEITGTQITGESFHEKIEEYKRQLLMTALAECNNNQRRAAEHLRMTYDQFRHYYRKYTSGK